MFLYKNHNHFRILKFFKYVEITISFLFQISSRKILNNYHCYLVLQTMTSDEILNVSKKRKMGLHGTKINKLPKGFQQFVY
jgi:hypothetical protein